MFENSLYVGVPFGAFLCFLFIFLCFLNASWTKAVRYFRMTILVCLVWTGGAVCMRLQVWPGLAFWYHVSLFGIFLLPVAMYHFLFYMLDIKSRQFVLVLWLVNSLLFVWNCFTGYILPPPEIVVTESGKTAYTYMTGPALGFFLVVEIAIFAYVAYLVLLCVRGNKSMKEKLTPMLIGGIFVLGGNVLELMPGNQFPFDTLGGVFMAFALVYIMYRQFLFDLGSRIIIGLIYAVSLVAVAVPVTILVRRVAMFTGAVSADQKQMLLLCMVFLSVWSIVVVLCGHSVAENLVEKKKREFIAMTQEFQSQTASLFSREELFDRLEKTIRRLAGNCNLWIFKKDTEAENGFTLKYEAADRKLSQKECRDMIETASEKQTDKQVFISLEYDGESWGFLCVELLLGESINYTKLSSLKQLGISASICLKNISIYDKVYENSIHDELTGLYNRTYSREYLENEFENQDRKGIILMDLDDFKLFNELYGEEMGDAILKWCASKIHKTVGKQGHVFRSGSNEFLVTMQTDDRQEICNLAEQIRQVVDEEDDGKPRVMQAITFSIGIAAGTSGGSTADELLKQAEKAVFFAKQSGKNRIEVYDNDLNTEESARYGGYEQIAPTVYALMAAIDAKDSYTFEHSGHVSDYAVLLARRCGMQKKELQIIREAGLLHDIGKISIPESILKKTGKLTKEEYEVMKTHVTRSIEIIHYLPNMDYVIPAVVSHHERYDGRGYPRGLQGEEIPYMGRILAVCDSFDAMVSRRSYKEAMTIEYAMEELERNKGTQFDPVIAEAFIGLIREGAIM